MIYGDTQVFWYKDFDGMACKTMLRQLISKWGIMSIELQNAYEKDMSVIHEDGSTEYIDTQIPEQQSEPEQQEQQPEIIIEYENANENQQTMTNEEFFAGTEA